MPEWPGTKQEWALSNYVALLELTYQFIVSAFVSGIRL